MFTAIFLRLVFSPFIKIVFFTHFIKIVLCSPLLLRLCSPPILFKALTSSHQFSAFPFFAPCPSNIISFLGFFPIPFFNKTSNWFLLELQGIERYFIRRILLLYGETIAKYFWNFPFHWARKERNSWRAAFVLIGPQIEVWH